MAYFETLMQQAAVICLSTSLDGAGAFVADIDSARLSQTEYLTVLAETATRVAGCAAYDPAGSFAFASDLAARVGGIYDPSDADQTLSYLRLLTTYMRIEPGDFPEERAVPGLRRVAAAWLDAWQALESAVDPAWRPGTVFPPFSPSRPVAVSDGVAPSGIADPTVRAEYEAWLGRRQAFLRRERNQSLLRRAEERYAPEVADYLGDLRRFDPAVLAPLGDRVARIRNEAVRRAAGS